MLATSAPNILFVIGIPIISMAILGVVCVGIYKALGAVFRS